MSMRQTLFTLIFTGMTTMSHAQTQQEIDQAREIIWAKELGIYKARPVTGLDYYIENASPNYVGWPPDIPSLMPIAQTKINQTGIQIPNSEKLEMFFDDFAMHGYAAVIYYNTHRTVMPDGSPTDQRFHITHVWVKDDDGDWKLLGAMGRLEGE